MKLKCTITGQIWDVDYIAASQGIRVSTFFSNYELIPDEPQSPEIATVNDAIMSNTRSIENITKACENLLSRVRSLESDNQRLKDRLNAIEGNWK